MAVFTEKVHEKYMAFADRIVKQNDYCASTNSQERGIKS